MSNTLSESKFQLVRPLPHENFDSDAMKVYEHLQKHHFKTYFVGGCIRDLLLGRCPKDFDIATSARPHQVSRLFPNSRLIGKRFIIVNVFYGRKNIEVTTFRRNPIKKIKKDSSLVNNYNVFGTEEEDVKRRDFTINSLFYEAHTRTLIDYLGSINDLQQGIIRSIGNPEIKFREDPVRMLRAVKFKAMFDFKLEKQTQIALTKVYPKIIETSVARLLLEMQKILHSGYSYVIFKELVNYKLMQVIANDLDSLWKNNASLQKSLQKLDKLSKEQRSLLSDDFLMLFITFPFIVNKYNKKIPTDVACRTLLNNLSKNFKFSKKTIDYLVRVIRLQFLLLRKITAPSHLKRIIKNPHFEQAWEFFLIQNQDEAEQKNLLQYWQEVKNTIEIPKEKNIVPEVEK